MVIKLSKIDFTCSNKTLKPWQTRKHYYLPMFRHVSKSAWQTLGNISEKHRETSNVSAFGRSKFCFRNVVSTGGQTWKHLRKHRESQMFPQQTFLTTPLQTESKLFVPPPHKGRNFSDPPPPVWIEKLTAMKQVCVAGNR